MSHRSESGLLGLLVLYGLAWSMPVCADTRFSYTGPAVPIPDSTPSGINVAIPVAGLLALTDVDVAFPTGGNCDATVDDPDAAISHTFVGDLRIQLTSPEGTQVVLIDRRGGTRENVCGVRLDDDGNFLSLDSITSVSGSSVSGTYNPEQPLSAFDGEDPNGLWILNVSDNSEDDTGALRRFSLVLDSVPIDIQVDVLDDPAPGSCTPGSCSLREAVIAANADPAPNRILLPVGTITLDRAGADEDAGFTGDLDISDDLIIEGAGIGSTIVAQSADDRILHVVNNSSDLGLRHLRLQDGKAVTEGGALLMGMVGTRLSVDSVHFYNNRVSERGGAVSHWGRAYWQQAIRTVELRNCIFEDNQASGSSLAAGGALHSIATDAFEDYLLIDNCSFTNNRADLGGGALLLEGVQSVSDVTGRIVNSSFVQNQVLVQGSGGAIASSIVNLGVFRLRVVDSLFDMNSVPLADAFENHGGAIALQYASSVQGSEFRSNQANRGGALYGDFELIENSTFCSNEAVTSGGAVVNGDVQSSMVRNSTFCSNSVSTSDGSEPGGGALLHRYGDLALERNTFSGNSALRGAAIAFEGWDLSLNGNTIVAPGLLPVGFAGSALRFTPDVPDAELHFSNNILIGQCSFAVGIDPPVSAFNNIEATGNTCRLLSAASQAGNQISVSSGSIGLAALSDNGGPTQTRMPSASSVAVDAGDPASCTELDQRSYRRGDDACDIGAVEVGGVPGPDLPFSDGFE